MTLSTIMVKGTHNSPNFAPLDYVIGFAVTQYISIIKFLSTMSLNFRMNLCHNPKSIMIYILYSKLSLITNRTFSLCVSVAQCFHL